MGTAQLQNWHFFSNPIKPHKVNFLLSDTDLDLLEERLVEVVKELPIFRAKLIEDPEYVNPIMYEPEGDEIGSKTGIVIIRDKKSTWQENFLCEANLIVCLKDEGKFNEVEFIFNPLMLDFNSIFLLLGEALHEQKSFGVLSENIISFSKYATWSNEILNEEEGTSEEFWDKRYENRTSKTDYPFGFESEVYDDQIGYGCDSILLSFNEISNANIRSLMELAPEASISAILISYYFLYSSGVNLQFGIAFSGRSFSELSHIVGPLTRFLPLIVNLFGKVSTFEDIVEETHRALDEMSEWQEYALSKTRENQNLPYDSSIHYIDHYGLLRELCKKANIADISNPVANSLSWTIIRKSKAKFQLYITYDKARFSRSLISKIMAQLNHLSKVLIENPTVQLDQLRLLSKNEKALTLGWLQGPKVNLNPSTIDTLFERSAKQFADNIALIYENKQMTYGELRDEANGLALALRQKFAQHDSGIIGVEIPSCPQQIVALLGIMKAGFAYLPLDEKIPYRRKLEFISNADAIGVIHNNESYEGRYGDRPSINIEKVIKTSGEIVNQDSNSLAYVIFTSGSTGKPKGVKINHKNIINTLCWRIREYKFGSKSVGIQIPRFSFDSSVEDIFSILLTGGKLVLLDEEKKYDANYMASQIDRQGVTNILMVPSLYKSLLPFISSSICNVKSVTLAGEALPQSLVEEHFDLLPNVQLINEYGPTECSVCSTFSRLRPNEPITIGNPIDNMSTYIVDSNEELLGPGRIGELYIAGPGISPGYLIDSELNKNRFVELNLDGSYRTYYKTGDFCRLGHKGKLFFIGRKDDQIKLRGHRIGLLEIENAILETGRISECVVLVKEQDTEKEIIAYCIPKNCSFKNDLSDSLKKELKSFLPDYMIPSTILKVAKWPLNDNGKINKNILLKLLDVRKERVNPSTTNEKVLLEIWKAVLNKNDISIEDDFYKVGGDSIKFIQVSARLFELGYKLEVKEIFRNPILRDQARLMELSHRNVSQELVKGVIPLTPIQKYFFSIPGWREQHYCQSVILKLNQHYEFESIQSCINKLIEHHDQLRVSFELNPIRQSIPEDRPKNEIGYISLNSSPSVEKIEELSKDYFSMSNIDNKKLFQVVFLNGQTEQYILIIAHHLLIDSVSWRILLEDLDNLLIQVKAEQELLLPLKTDSFQKYAQLITALISDIEGVIPKGLSEYSDYQNPGLHMVVKNSNSLVREERRRKLSISESDVAEIRRIANLTQLEIRFIILACIGHAVKKTFTQNEMFLIYENHGRNDFLDCNVNRTVGWFTSIVPLLLPTDSKGNVRAYIDKIKDSFSKVYNKDFSYFLNNFNKKADTEQEFRPFDIVFNYIGDIDSEIERLKSFNLFADRINGEISNDRYREAIIEIYVFIREGKLEVEFIYSQNQLSTNIIAIFSDTFKEYLFNILKFFDNKIATNNFDYDKLSEEDLQSIFEE